MISFSQRKESRQKTIHVSEKQLQKNSKTAHKTRYMHIEITFIGNNKKKSLVFLLKTKKLCLFMVIFWVNWEKYIEKTKKVPSFQNHDTLIQTLSWVGFFYSSVGFFTHGWKTSSALFSIVFLPRNVNVIVNL